MKKVFLLLIALIFLAACSAGYANTINVDVGDFFFSPVSFDVAVGDTVVWTLSSGSHTTTSTSVPGGAATWDYTFSGMGDSFTYIVMVAGVYEYQCNFHPTLMRGSFSTPAPLPYVENFEYPVDDLLAYHGWANHSGTGSFVTLFTGSLSFAGYPASGIGNHVQLFGGGGSREDIHRGFEQVSSGGLYVAFLINVATADANDGYVAHFMPPAGSFNYRARFFLQDDGTGNLNFGISKGSSSTVSYVGTNYSYGQTYLIVIKYEYVGDPTGTDDIVKLWVDPDLSQTEPANGDAENIDSAGDEVLEFFALRQGSEVHEYQFDGLTISTTWSTLVPVELTSFSASVNNSAVSLNWSTATELNNSGFEIERRTKSSANWNRIGFVEGSGTTTETKTYSFTDANIAAGSYSYRLKQVDFDGTFEYSEEIFVDVNTPTRFELSQNYPNPFNPSTKIKFSLAQGSDVSLKIYNALGEEVSTLVNKFMEAGVHSVNFEASQLQSGIYFYRLEAGTFSEVRKMTLLK